MIEPQIIARLYGGPRHETEEPHPACIAIEQMSDKTGLYQRSHPTGHTIQGLPVYIFTWKPALFPPDTPSNHYDIIQS
jgi:hypothetical protein